MTIDGVAPSARPPPPAKERKASRSHLGEGTASQRRPERQIEKMTQRLLTNAIR
jgi:hypothetical protein